MVLEIAEIVEIAKRIVEQEFGEWPEDEWFGLGDDWDVNAYLDGETKKIALYPVENGSTKTQIGIVLEI